MKTSTIIKSIFALSLIPLLIGCSGGGSSSTETNETISPTSYATSGVLVDPFISGSVLCEDVNKNAVCDINEQLSSVTDANGQFTFEHNLTAGSHIIVKSQGFHNGVPYTLDLSGIVDENGEIKVVSPLTTLQTKQLTTLQIVALLQSAGLTNITEDDILSNPLEGGINTLNDDNSLRKLQATVATYGMLKTIKGSKRLQELTSDELVNSKEIKDILTVMVSNIKDTLSKATLDEIQTQTQSFKRDGFNPPDVTVSVVAATAITIMDALTKVAYDKCNQTDGSDSQKIEAALKSFEENKNFIIAKTEDIGMRYYAMENRSTFEMIPSQYHSLFPQAIQDGLAMSSSDAVVLGTKNFDIQKQSSEVANFILQAHASTSVEALPTLITTCPNSGEDQPHYAAGLDCDNDGGVVAFETPRKFKVAFKSLALINQNGDKEYLINQDSLEKSIVFDISDPKVLGDLTIPLGTYTAVEVEIYYYWLDMQMYNKNEYTQFRIYMSDDNPTHPTEGHHQGDVTLTDENNQEIGWLSAGGIWKTSYAVTVRDEPIEPQTKLYSSSADPITNRQRGPYGGDELWNYEVLNPNDIFTVRENINLVVNKESKLELTFNVKNNWYWEDYNGDGIFGAAVHESPNNDLIEASDENATWSPIITMPKISTVY